MSLKWIDPKFPAINANPKFVPMFGADAEPKSSIWLASMSEGLGDNFCEGMIVLDYGCGGGRYCNFVSQRLQDFKYYGVEPSGSIPKKGYAFTNIELCRMNYSDSRVAFGDIGSDFEKTALDKVTAIIAGSIFTHLVWEDFERVADKMVPAVNRGAVFSFSVFFGDEYYVEKMSGKENDHNIGNCYPWVIYTWDQINGYAKQRNVSIEKKTDFQNTRFVQNILSMTKI